jgi:hypothetical protein
MRISFALSVLLTALVAGLGAGVAVLVAWSRTTSVPDATSPALWAARTYMAYFDLSAIIAFLPCQTVCSWIRTRLAPAPPALFVLLRLDSRDLEFPL